MVSKFEMFGDKNIFEERLKEGYTEVAFGRGNPVNNNNYRIFAIWIFYNSHTIATQEYIKILNSSPQLVKPPFEREYSNEEFEEYIKSEKILSLSKKENLDKIVKRWDYYCQCTGLKPIHHG